MLLNLALDANILKGIIYNRAELSLNNVNFTNINYRIIYNEGNIIQRNTIFNNILSSTTSTIEVKSTNQQINHEYFYNNYRIKTVYDGIHIVSKPVDGGAIYNNNNILIENCSFNTITGRDGGAIYNNKDLTILNSIFQKITGRNGGTLYNAETLNINNTLINGSTGRVIYNNGVLTVNNAVINKCGGIYNNNQLNINNTIFSECNGVGAAVWNNNVANIENCEIIQSHGRADDKRNYVEQPDGQIFEIGRAHV